MPTVRISIVVLLLAILGGVVVVRGERPQDPPPRLGPDGKPEPWMIAKLHDAQDVFAGLTSGNFDAVNLNARRMLISNLLEQWSRKNAFTKSSAYEAEVNSFDYAVKELIRTSANHDSSGALDAYVRLTKSCVQCHQLIRDFTPQP